MGTNCRVLAVLVLLLRALPALSQGGAATLSGRVTDPSGLPVAGVKVQAIGVNTGITYLGETNALGLYNLPFIPPGAYQITVNKEGFQQISKSGVDLHVADIVAVNFTLSIGAVEQTIEVGAEMPLVESTTASLGSLVDDRTIRALPLNGRSYDQLALLQPGVILTSPGQLAGTSFRYGSGKRFSVGGQRPASNSFLLDGTNINDQGNGTPGGAAGTNLGVDTILEFKIFTNSYKAEYGHSNGSVVSAITRSGTNTLHGTAFEYIRNSALDARNFFDVGSSPPSFKRNQFGGVLGGPIKKDKTFIFGGYEGLRQGLGTTLIATVPTLLAKQGILPTGTVPVNPASVPYLNLYPLPNGRDFGDGTGEFLSSPTIVTNQDNFMVRVDSQLNAKTGIFARYTFDNDKVNSADSLPNLFQVFASRRQYTTLQANSILGPNAVNNFRFAFNRSNSAEERIVIPDPGPQLALVPGQPLGAINLGGVTQGATRAITPLGPSNGNGADLYVNNIFQWANDFSYATREHSLKTGVDIQRVRYNTVNGGRLRGAYTFRTFTDFLAGSPANLQAVSPLGIAAYYGVRQMLYAVYGQDDYTVNSRLTLNLGLRWEATTDPREVNGKSSFLPSPAATEMVISDRFFSSGKKNFQPRFGLAWQLNASGTTVLRAGGGIYHNQILPWLYGGQIVNPPFSGIFSANNPPFPNGYQVLTGGGLINLQTMAPVNKTPVNYQYNLSIQQEIFRNTVVQVAYAGNKANHLGTQRETDTPIPTILPDGRKFFPAGAPRRNPAWNGIRLSETDGNSVYNSVTVTLRRQSSSGFQGQIFYTFSKAMDEASATSNSDSRRSPQTLLDPENRRGSRGLADFDSKHNVVFNFSYPVPFRAGSKALGAVANGWTLDGIATFTAGQPFTARLASSVSRDLASSLAERPDLKPGASQNPNQGTTVGCAGIPAGQKLRTADRFYDPCSFSLPLAGTYGNLGRNTIIGPGVANVDLALGKSFKLREEAVVTFKAELFNLMNHANFGLPNTTVLAAGGAANSSAGRVSYTTTSSRQLQFALRISF